MVEKFINTILFLIFFLTAGFSFAEAGFVYIMTNENGNYLKIGVAKNTELIRAREVNGATGIPVSLQIYSVKKAADYKEVEDFIDQKFDRNRIGKHFNDRVKSPFFSINLKDACAELSKFEIPPKRKKRSPFTFSSLDIPVGATLLYINNDCIKAEVFNNKDVLNDGRRISLSSLTARLLNRKSIIGVKTLDYWTYEGERLSDRRTRME